MHRFAERFLHCLVAVRSLGHNPHSRIELAYVAEANVWAGKRSAAACRRRSKSSIIKTVQTKTAHIKTDVCPAEIREDLSVCRHWSNRARFARGCCRFLSRTVEITLQVKERAAQLSTDVVAEVNSYERLRVTAACQSITSRPTTQRRFPTIIRNSKMLSRPTMLKAIRATR